MLDNAKELLELCDQNIAKVVDKKNDYLETIIYLLDKRGIVEETAEYLGHSYDKMLTFDYRAGLNIPTVVFAKDGGRTDATIEAMVTKMYNKVGVETLDKFITYLISEAIPKFRAGINIQNFEY